MDAFYVSVELLRHPELRGQPVVVGGTAGRGVVSAASYEARRYGVFSAMSSAVARKLCPDAVFIAPDMAHYLDVSRHLHEVFESFTPLVEQISVDEAFMDVTGSLKLFGNAATIGWLLRERVLEETGLSCSVGVAPTKFLAKLASEHAKPRASANGIDAGHQVFEVLPGEELAFLHPLPVQSLWGVGPATLAKLEALGIRVVADLAALDENIVCSALGDSHGRHLHSLSRGIDNRDVVPERIAKSIGHEETFSSDLATHEELRVQLVKLCDAVSRRTRDAGVAAGTLMLKVKFSSFESVTRSVTPALPLTTGPSMVAMLEPLLQSLDCSQGVRLLGVHAQKLTTESQGALRLFDDENDSVENIEEQWLPAAQAMDSITDKFGSGLIGPASAMDQRRPGENPFGPVLDE
jgi:DNA polymerase-4